MIKNVWNVYKDIMLVIIHVVKQVIIMMEMLVFLVNKIVQNLRIKNVLNVRKIMNYMEKYVVRNMNFLIVNKINVYNLTHISKIVI